MENCPKQSLKENPLFRPSNCLFVLHLDPPPAPIMTVELCFRPFQGIPLTPGFLEEDDEIEMLPEDFVKYYPPRFSVLFTSLPLFFISVCCFVESCFSVDCQSTFTVSICLNCFSGVCCLDVVFCLLSALCSIFFVLFFSRSASIFYSFFFNFI